MAGKLEGWHLLQAWELGCFLLKRGAPAGFFSSLFSILLSSSLSFSVDLPTRRTRRRREETENNILPLGIANLSRAAPRCAVPAPLYTAACASWAPPLRSYGLFVQIPLGAGRFGASSSNALCPTGAPPRPRGRRNMRQRTLRGLPCHAALGVPCAGQTFLGSLSSRSRHSSLFLSSSLLVDLGWTDERARALWAPTAPWAPRVNSNAERNARERLVPASCTLHACRRHLPGRKRIPATCSLAAAACRRAGWPRKMMTSDLPAGGRRRAGWAETVGNGDDDDRRAAGRRRRQEIAACRDDLPAEAVQRGKGLKEAGLPRLYLLFSRLRYSILIKRDIANDSTEGEEGN